MFDRLLIANRGEIACRIMRTARRMGIQTIAVYSEADAGARHMREADEAVLIGPPPASESYLVIDKIIAAAQRTHADAIHPGYGFLSENEDFAEACAKAGLIFVGPPVGAIRAMGSKSEAKALMAKANVPLVPGYHGADQDPALLAREAVRIGFPVLIKPSAGGGGKGMHVVESAEAFDQSLATARREAKSSFGDDRVLIEKYLQRPRHIEVQVFADTHGNSIHLFARDCSVQRRHQKVVEEAPAPGLSAAQMNEMGAAAVAAARAVNYVGAGTVEFIAEGGTFHFMEMNTRLQVEHPVTEMVTGLDLVEWQLRVAAGEKLPLTQGQVTVRGHAVEARVYAEDPRRDFLPSTGKLVHVSWPEQGSNLRVDSGVEAGDSISPYYDPMIAKVIAWGEDRSAALRRLANALESSAVVGVANNIPFLASILRYGEFAAGPVDTGFLGRHMAELAAPAPAANDTELTLAALSVLAEQRKTADADPWSIADGWQLNGEANTTLTFRDGEYEITVGVRYRRDGGYALTLPGGVVQARAHRDSEGVLHADLDGHRVQARAIHVGTTIHIYGPRGPITLTRVDPYSGSGGDAHGTGHLSAPMPGAVVAVAVKAGDKVARGARLMVIEAMKMEHSILAPADGTVTTVRFAVGDKVREGEELIEFAAAEAAQ
ncbi:MAG TPA: acetyl/propionyl/methylcrotonyl-CoA carboxylase subunit alpha [Magnetospirillaceae bacterium]|jgi:3-methylcrotonyl-CoA carboxylase alpha subunit